MGKTKERKNERIEKNKKQVMSPLLELVFVKRKNMSTTQRNVLQYYSV